MTIAQTATSIKGNRITGAILYGEGAYEGTFTSIEDDWEARGAKFFGYGSTDAGLSFSHAATVTPIKAFGDDMLGEIISEETETLSIEVISYKNLETLQVLFGKDNVSQVGDEITIKNKGAHSERFWFVLNGVDLYGKKTSRLYRQLSLDPNFEYSWQDSDIVRIPITLNAYRADDDSFWEEKSEVSEAGS